MREAAGVQQVTVRRCNKGGGGTKEQVKGERERVRRGGENTVTKNDTL